ncbi:sensor histidine kinase [Bacillus methanolicus]|uniref:histidine kinase n=1 Tax=Bacillus methanolicus (strain MGA3 / ATCC 53907) TaxID=796606 RepID=I3E969_BACMM|nr:sensor histidine kinase [Bacillus methanolicus]AIE60295.1 Sensor histidine kinase YvfT [Bacillus methanolicus MGA3]EIJ83040.1 two-component sensor histidine kinase [Bacillus methanolicus MGA3]
MLNFKGRQISIFPRRYGFFPYIFLIYILFPIYYLMSETRLKQVIGYGMVCLFLVTYRQLYFAAERLSFSTWLALQLLIIFIFSMFYNLNFLFLGFFPANFIGWYKDKRMFKWGIISLIFVELVPLCYHLIFSKLDISTKELLYFVPFLIIMFISPYGIRSMNKRMELEKQLDQANQQIKELVKREERLRIARDLHDTLGHTLSLLTLKSQLVQRLTAIDPERARIEAKEMEVTSRAALKQVRELVSDMRAATIAEELLQIQQFLKAAGIDYHYNGEDDFAEISPFTQNIMSLCLREAATNVVKHSRAKNCFISIYRTSDHFKVIIKDDGIGMADHHSYGNGLNGIKERLDLIDGTLFLFNHNGTVLEMTVPIIQKAEKEGAAL